MTLLTAVLLKAAALTPSTRKWPIWDLWLMLLWLYLSTNANADVHIGHSLASTSLAITAKLTMVSNLRGKLTHNYHINDMTWHTYREICLQTWDQWRADYQVVDSTETPGLSARCPGSQETSVCPSLAQPLVHWQSPDTITQLSRSTTLTTSDNHHGPLHYSDNCSMKTQSSEWVSSFLTAHQHIKGHSVP